jgi:ADP-heptose:LPS heptosyltransferase
MDKPAAAADQHRLVGATPVTAEPRLQVTAADRAAAAAALAADDRPLVVLHPGANDPRRRWPTGYWPPSKGTRSI